ncbi:16S rRNA (cytidine(1402)-2'-O)-methyltransferase [Pelagibaculum spongiae]|uniref:Ribosomal RNA small subunit methyltransferase I n=1 Tax=Pelagibaculum spongiae TaxID=2080658 RepID=A0A2V1GXI6_9GAMM|nr:16S rRNA (cytidine(1402)-2'-O)-methyltransferase [Pelagibaculum spongiae]PVZ71881.1 16S rRNA (cytidine(1402)-2'-O)-methyltransferase [Pelagibaculum spongiae]
MDEKTNITPATLYIVATPIGNLQDISARALAVLAQVDGVAAEDTRHTRKLLDFFGIKQSLVSLHDYNEQARSVELVKRLANGESLALVSDAGTPLISDPGYRLVSEVRKAGFAVSPVPGACALVAALSASGLPSDRFAFEGFLPAKSSGRKQKLEAIAADTRTLIFYESCHRIESSLQDMQQALGDRQVVLGREITKRFETFLEGSFSELLVRLAEDSDQKRGEFVVLVRGADEDITKLVSLDAEKVLKLLLPELPPKKAVKIAAELTGEAKNVLYQMALDMKDQ